LDGVLRCFWEFFGTCKRNYSVPGAGLHIITACWLGYY